MDNICAKILNLLGDKWKIDWDNKDNYFIGWGSPFDPDDYTYKVFRTEQNSNYIRYSNKEVDRILKEAIKLIERNFLKLSNSRIGRNKATFFEIMYN